MIKGNDLPVPPFTVVKSYGAYSFKSSTVPISTGRKSLAPSIFRTASLASESLVTTCTGT